MCASWPRPTTSGLPGACSALGTRLERVSPTWSRLRMMRAALWRDAITHRRPVSRSNDEGSTTPLSGWTAIIRGRSSPCQRSGVSTRIPGKRPPSAWLIAAVHDAVAACQADVADASGSTVVPSRTCTPSARRSATRLAAAAAISWSTSSGGPPSGVGRVTARGSPARRLASGESPRAQRISPRGRRRERSRSRRRA